MLITTFKAINKQQWIKFVTLVLLSFAAILANNYRSLNFANADSSQTNTVRLKASIKTADDASYLAPVKNLIAGKNWKDNSEGVQSYYTRTPGYGLFCLPYYFFFSEKTALSLIVITQCLLIAVVAGLMFLMFLKWQIPDIYALVFGLIFGLIPSFSGYVFYTLTEGISPVILFLTFFLYIFSKKSYVAVISLSIVLGYLILTRPAFATFVVLIIPLFAANKDKLLKKIFTISVATAFLVGPIALWEIRNHNLGKKFEGVDNLHSIYSPSNNNVWRAPHKAIYGLVKQFEINGQAYHDWNQKIESGSSIENLSIFDDQCVQLFGRDTLSKYTLMYQQTINEAPALAKQNMYSKKELILVDKFTEFKHQYQSEYKITSYVESPLKVLKNIIWQSHLNLYQYWHTYKDSWWIKPFSLLTSLLHLSIYMLPVFFLMYNRKTVKKHWALILAAGLYLGYLIFIQRGVEQRYTYPLLPIFYASSVSIAFKFIPVLISFFIDLFKSRNSSNISSGDQ